MRAISILSRRTQLILELLVALMNSGFDYKKTWNEHQKEFLLLSSDNPDYKWEVKSPEMIAFHDWFKSKALKSEYSLSVAVNRKKTSAEIPSLV